MGREGDERRAIRLNKVVEGFEHWDQRALCQIQESNGRDSGERASGLLKCNYFPSNSRHILLLTWSEVRVPL